ncbi:SGNH/GDSL hydrolase family protein [Arthrobacter bambusae]|uniref:SGNH/GDSL hydrolase family protein n=1 Tax=Arthrobacter bambusae TaxID=1338426 RepID=UPI0027807FB7|nr:SGNH/GDSL hydrolase family protein [Arthrobacter bambusae]MDQ0031246.1 lysophospholipase L1-like esterase [Arthrobacter bambusae]MDQ0099464.1 lysophospholipase L1-like esterase [Arthrobacter bambusae]
MGNRPPWRSTAIATACLCVLAVLNACSWDTGPRPGAATPTPTVVIIGDSLSTGHGTSPADAWPNLVENDPGFQRFQARIVNAAQDGSGYVSVGNNGSTFGSQVDTAVTDGTRLALFFGSENDMGTSPGETEAAAARAFASVKLRAPHAQIVVVGPPSYTGTPEAERLNIRDQDKAAALKAGAEFVDPIDLGWIMDDAADLIGPDGDHPSAAGQQYLKAKMEALIEARIQ